MTLRNVHAIFRKDLTGGPRGLVVIWLVVFPLLVTLLVRMILGDLIDPAPRLGIVDLGSSSISAAVMEVDGIEVERFDNSETVMERLRTNDLDAGLILQPGFDEAVRSGTNPPLQIYVSGQSVASTRVILAVTTVDLIRSVAGEPAPVEVVTEIVGGGSQVPIGERLVPILVLLAVALCAIFLPAAGLIQERERHTLDAVLVTPATLEEFLLAKGLEGFVMALFTGMLTLLLNLGFGVHLAANVVIIAVASLMCVPIGLIVGSVVKDIATMFTIWKSGAIVLFAPAVLFLFPTVPRWIAMLFPTYYFMGPLYDVNIGGVAFGETIWQLGVALAISVALVIGSARAGLKMEQRLASA